MTCLPCSRGFHEECYKENCKRCHPKKKEPVVITGVTEEYKKRGKTAEGLKDAESTGRKRAAELYPINSGDPCEWRKKKNCGGGRYPIIGCLSGYQQHRHHGPVKDTTRNQSGNVHRICSSCHNHWHELNDLAYDAREYGLLPHDPEAATDEEVALNAVDWMSGVIGKKYKLASAHNKRKKND